MVVVVVVVVVVREVERFSPGHLAGYKTLGPLHIRESGCSISVPQHTACSGAMLAGPFHICYRCPLVMLVIEDLSKVPGGGGVKENPQELIRTFTHVKTIEKRRTNPSARPSTRHGKRF